MLLDMGTFMLHFPCPLEIRIEVVCLLEQLACRIHLSVSDKTSLATVVVYQGLASMC